MMAGSKGNSRIKAPKSTTRLNTSCATASCRLIPGPLMLANKVVLVVPRSAPMTRAPASGSVIKPPFSAVSVSITAAELDWIRAVIAVPASR